MILPTDYLYNIIVYTVNRVLFVDIQCDMLYTYQELIMSDNYNVVLFCTSLKK